MSWGCSAQPGLPKGRACRVTSTALSWLMAMERDSPRSGPRLDPQRRAAPTCKGGFGDPPAGVRPTNTARRLRGASGWTTGGPHGIVWKFPGRGGLTRKIHLACDALGRPLALLRRWSEASIRQDSGLGPEGKAQRCDRSCSRTRNSVRGTGQRSGAGPRTPPLAQRQVEFRPYAAVPGRERVLSYAFVDCRGYGKAMDTPGTYTMEEVAADALAVADDLGLEHLLGHRSLHGRQGGPADVAGRPLAVRSIVGISPVPASGFPLEGEMWELFVGAVEDVGNRRTILMSPPAVGTTMHGWMPG